MEPTPRAITWEAPEHHHVEKGSNWYLVLLILVFALFVTAIIFNNVILALLIAVAGATLAIAASKPPRLVTFAVTVRGVRIEENLFPYSTLEAYYIDEEDHKGAQLLLRSKQRFMPLLVMPIPDEYIDEIEDILKERLEEEHMEESLLSKVLELFGF
jgi:hypothetical protein